MEEYETQLAIIRYGNGKMKSIHRSLFIKVFLCVENVWMILWCCENVLCSQQQGFVVF